MFHALIAAFAGAIFMALASIPPIAAINACCGVLYVGAGFLSAWVWVKLSGGRASFGWCLTSGCLAGVLFGVGTMGTSAVSLWVGAEAFAAKLNESALIREFPDGEVTAEQLLDFWEAQVQADTTRSEDEKLAEIANTEGLRQDLAKARADPENSKKVDQWMNWVVAGLQAAKRGDTSPLMIPVLVIMGLVGMLLACLSSVGGLIGGLMLGDDTPTQVKGEAA